MGLDNIKLEHRRRGANVLVTQGTPSGAFMIEALQEEHTFALLIQPKSAIPAGSVLTATVQYGIGEALFTKSRRIISQVARPFKVRGRSIELSLTLTGPVGTQLLVGCAVSIDDPQTIDPAGYLPLWIQTPAAAGALAQSYLLASGAGVMIDAQVNLASIPAGARWALFFDLAAAPPGAGVIPIPGGRSGVFPGLAISSQSFSGDLSPLEFSTGLVVALSTTPDVFTAPPLGETFTCDAELGT